MRAVLLALFVEGMDTHPSRPPLGQAPAFVRRWLAVVRRHQVCVVYWRPGSWLSGRGLGDQPWRCLWRRLSQMTMTRPWRRMTLHLSQIGLTLGLALTGGFSFVLGGFRAGTC